MAAILVVDDEAAIRSIVEAYLKTEGITVYLAEDGMQGLALFRRYKPDLIILDHMLPGMDGIDLTAREFKLLKLLATYPGMILNWEQLLEQVWGYDYYGEDRVVDVQVGHIRQKLEPNPAESAPERPFPLLSQRSLSFVRMSPL